jgi:hypothetical protein
MGPQRTLISQPRPQAPILQNSSNKRNCHVRRVELDRELKSEYQRFLRERNRGDRDSDGRPDRNAEGIAALGA